MVEIKDIVKQFKQVVRRHYSVAKVIVFGSYVKGKSSPSSDIDIAVISDDFKHRNRIAVTKKLLSLGQQIDVRIEPIGFTYQEYKHCEKTSFLSEIKRYGKAV